MLVCRSVKRPPPTLLRRDFWADFIQQRIFHPQSCPALSNATFIVIMMHVKDNEPAQKENVLKILPFCFQRIWQSSECTVWCVGGLIASVWDCEWSSLGEPSSKGKEAATTNQPERVDKSTVELLLPTWMLFSYRKKVKQDQWVLIEGLGQLAVFFLERRCRVPTLSISTLWAEGKMAADEAMETGEGSSILDPDAQKR